MRKSVKVFKKAFREPKVYGNLIGDASLASIVNFLYTSNKGVYEFTLFMVSILGIITGVILKERIYDDNYNS